MWPYLLVQLQMTWQNILATSNNADSLSNSLLEKILTVPCSVADPDPWNPYLVPGSGSVPYKKDGWIRNPDPTKTIENIK